MAEECPGIADEEVAALCSGCPIGDMVVQIAEKLPDAKVSAIQQVVESRIHAIDQRCGKVSQVPEVLHIQPALGKAVGSRQAMGKVSVIEPNELGRW